MVCRSGSGTDSSMRSGNVRLNFLDEGFEIRSKEKVRYLLPKIRNVEPLSGIESGGSSIKIFGENFSIGNGNVEVFLGSEICRIEKIEPQEISCETNFFEKTFGEKEKSIKIFFDKKTRISFGKFFSVENDPIVFSFDRFHKMKSFRSGARRIEIRGSNFDFVQKIQLEFEKFLFLEPIFRNSTFLTFKTPSASQLQLQNRNQIQIVLRLDNLRKTSTLFYFDDPKIFPFTNFQQNFQPILTIRGENLTLVGHRKDEISVTVACHSCPILSLTNEQIFCQTPNKIQQINQNCFDGNNPRVIVKIDDFKVFIGVLVYPKRFFLIGKIWSKGVSCFHCSTFRVEKFDQPG